MKSALYLLLIGWSFFSFGQTEDAFVYFNDKPDAQYFLENPLEMLSQRALERRQNQSIQLDITDVPVHFPYINEVENSVLVLAQSKWLNAVYVRGNYQAILTLGNLTFVESVEFANKSLNPEGRVFFSTQKPSSSQNLMNYKVIFCTEILPIKFSCTTEHFCINKGLRVQERLLLCSIRDLKV